MQQKPARIVFLASILGLFLELALVRWVSSEVRVFAYCKNLVLIACFLGFGAGCFWERKKPAWVTSALLLLLLVLVVRLPWQSLDQYGPRRVTAVLSQLSGFMIFRHEEAALPWSALFGLLFAVGWTVALFFVVAFAMLPYGQATARGIREMSRPLAGYTVNVFGSLIGLLAYFAASAARLPPLCWIPPVVLASAFLVRGAAARRVVLALAAALTLALLPDDGPARQDLWSPYQKLTLMGQNGILANNSAYFLLEKQEVNAEGDLKRVNRWNMPFLLRRPVGRVLIVGAGGGNDVASALLGGATSVTAVEIDRAIYEIGRARHPQRPYSDPRVRVVIDDARHFLRTTDQTFDLIVFSHLDSHTVLSSHTNVRLDNYIYTIEAFQEARRRLAPQGILYLTYFSELDFISQRLAKNLSLAFGRDPLSYRAATNPKYHEVFLMISDEATQARLAENLAQLPSLQPEAFARAEVVPSSDDWPFLPLDRRRVPPIVAVISGAILLVSVLLAGRARPQGEAFDATLFWLGAAFLLLETHNVSRLALLFGTTWQVNAWVIGVILSLILAANALCLRIGVPPLLKRLATAGLFASLLLAYVLPLARLQEALPLGGDVLATLLLCLPIFFSAVVFADAFSKSASPGFALGWNVLGAAFGGMAENLSYVFGLSSLALFAALFYAAAFLWPRPKGAASA